MKINKDINIISKSTHNIVKNNIDNELLKIFRGTIKYYLEEFFRDSWNFENLILEKFNKKYKNLKKQIDKWNLKECTCRYKIKSWEEFIELSYDAEHLVKEYFTIFQKIQIIKSNKDIKNEIKKYENIINNNSKFFIKLIKNWTKEKINILKYEKKKMMYIEKWKNCNKSKVNEELIYLKECYEKIYILYLQGNVTEDLYKNANNILLLKNTGCNDYGFYEKEMTLFDTWKIEGIQTLFNIKVNKNFIEKERVQFMKWNLEGYSLKKYYKKAIEFWEENKFPELFKENQKKIFRKNENNLTIYGKFYKFYINIYYKKLNKTINDYSIKRKV